MRFRLLALGCLLACAHGPSIAVSRGGALEIAHFWARVHPDVILPQAAEECSWTAMLVQDTAWVVDIKKKAEAAEVAYPGCLCDYQLTIDANSGAPTRFRCNKAGIDRDLQLAPGSAN